MTDPVFHFAGRFVDVEVSDERANLSGRIT